VRNKKGRGENCLAISFYTVVALIASSDPSVGGSEAKDMMSVRYKIGHVPHAPRSRSNVGAHPSSALYHQW
jgi:hypothetical protein